MKMIWAGFGIVNHAGIQKMNREEKQLHELWLIDRIVDDCLKDSKLMWADHPRSQELKDLQSELYPEEE